MPMPLQADPAQLTAQRRLLAELKPNAPAPLASVLDRIGHAFVEIGQEGAPVGRVRARAFEGPGGNWKVSRFGAYGIPWVGVEWPTGANRVLTDWLFQAMHDCRLATDRPNVPGNQLWFYCGAGR